IISSRSQSVSSHIMAERKRADRDDDLPVYLARPGTADQVPRQKYGGLFCNVEGAYESKTIDFDALTVEPQTEKSRSLQSTKRTLHLHTLNVNLETR
ncbi:hypothetical protein M9458_041332, partial [Cirrhinus mrigala]